MTDPEAAKSYFRRALKLSPGFKEAREALNAIELGPTSNL
jgi:hypothetical protein